MVIVKWGDTVAPAATVTEDGTVAWGSLLVRFTMMPLPVAGPVSVTRFDVVEAPPVTEAGDSVAESRAAGFTVRFAVLVTPLYDPEIVTTVCTETADVAIVKKGDTVAPGATVTESGVIACGSLLVRFTVTPAPAAGPVSVSRFDVVGTPPTTEVGDGDNESNATGLTVKMAVLVTPLYVAEIVTIFGVETNEVPIVKTGDAVAPAATVTEAGTPTPGSLLLRLTTMPPAGAGPFRFTLLDVVGSPATIDVGDRATESNAGGLTVRRAVLVTPLYVAEIVTIFGVETNEVVIVKTGDAVAPAATVTEAGTPTPGSLLLKLTLIPPAGAGPLRFTLLDVVGSPATTDVGDRATESNATGLTVRMAVLVTPLYVAEIVTMVVTETNEVVIVKTGDAVAPAATVTEAGTPTPGSLLVKLTRMPPAGAGPLRFTLLDVVGIPATTDVGDRATESNATGLTVKMAVLVTPLYVAEIVTVLVVETNDVVIVKTGDAVAPAATVTEAGTPTPGSLLLKLTTMPPAGAGAFRVTLFAVVAVPPTTEAGDRTGVATKGFTVRMAILVLPL